MLPVNPGCQNLVTAVVAERRIRRASQIGNLKRKRAGRCPHWNGKAVFDNRIPKRRIVARRTLANPKPGACENQANQRRLQPNQERSHRGQNKVTSTEGKRVEARVRRIQKKDLPRPPCFRLHCNWLFLPKPGKNHHRLGYTADFLWRQFFQRKTLPEPVPHRRGDQHWSM